MDLARHLRRKFIVTALSAVTAVLVVIVGCINVVNYIGVLERTDARLDLIERGRTEGASLPDENGPLGTASRHGISAETPFDIRFFTVTVDEDGSSREVDTKSIAAVTARQAAAMAEEAHRSGRSTGFASAYRFRRIEAGESSGEKRVTYVFLDCARELGQFSTFLKASIAISGIGLALVCALVTALSGIAIKPIVESHEKQRRFVTDASHELKTPLSVIDANTEVVEMTKGEDEWTRGIHDQVARMSQLTERLVFLARMDEDASLELADCDLSRLAERTLEPYSAVALACGKRLSTDIEPHVRCRGNAASLAQALCLLLDNAMRYAREGSVIMFRLHSRGRLRIIEVSNACEHIPSGDLDRLFERFYRSDDSRARETGGSGIGLSVVRAVAEAHHGRAFCTAANDETICFTMEIRA